MSLESWTPRPLPAPAFLEGRFARLERLDWRAHGRDLFASLGGQSNAELWRYMPIGPFLSAQSLEDDFERARTGGGWNTLAVRVLTTDRIEGMASFMRLRPEHGSAEIGCVAFGHSLQRSTAATEAVYLMARHVFDDLGYRRFEWKCDNANDASKRAALRFGFTHEGLFRQDMVRKGANRDTAWYSIIDREWPAVRAGFERWLDAANFDAAGRQKQGLAALRGA